jgi:DegV family protein with EDD domain
MLKAAVVTDSIACLTREMVEQYGVRVVPISFNFGERVYRDWVDITPSEAYELFLTDPECFKTTPASPGDYLEAYREVSKQAKDILCITISSKLSTAYNVARVAKEQAEAEIPRTSVEVLDSHTVAAAEGFIVLAAARAALAGKSLSEVAKVAKETKDRVNLIAIMDTVRYVYRSGRIPKVAAWAGAMLDIRPIFTISSGVVHLIRVDRNKQHGIEHLLKIMKDEVGLSPVHVAVMHAYAPDEAERLRERVSSEFNCAEIWVSEFSPVMGYACGTGTLGLAFYKES